MSGALIAVSLIIAGVTTVLCILQIVKRVSNVVKRNDPPAAFLNDGIFRAYLFRVSLFSLLVFLPSLAFGYYLEFVRHQQHSPELILLCGGSYVGFLFLAAASETLLRRMLQRATELQRESISRIFRFFLYAGALLGLVTMILAILYAWYAQRRGISGSELLLLPVYAASLLVFWLRFHGALVARTSDYAFELMRRQEAILPLTGAYNPLWRLRQLFSVVNRFFFYHLEYLILCLIVLTIGHRIEIHTSLAAKGGSGLILSVFAIGTIAAIPAFFVMRVRDKTSPETFLWNIRIGYIAALATQAIAFYLIFVVYSAWHIKYFWIVFLGALTAFLLNLYSAVFVAENHKTARSLISAAASSVSTVVHRGIAAGMRGAAIPALIIAAMMALVYLLGVVDEKGEQRFVHGLFALALALTSMISLFGVAQATALIMPLSSSVIGRLRLRARQEDVAQLLSKFRNLRSVSVPSYVLHAKIFYSALVILIFLVYTQLLSEAGPASLFKHLTETAAMLLGGIASYFLAARINELVLNLGPLLVRETGRQFREISGLSSGETEPDLKNLWRTANAYLRRKLLPLYTGTMVLPALACLLGGTYGLTGYLIGFGFFSFLNGNSWLTTGAAWSSARHAAEADSEVSRHTAQMEALVQADIVGDSMHEAAAPTLSAAVLSTLTAALLFTPATLELHEQLRDFVLRLF